MQSACIGNGKLHANMPYLIFFLLASCKSWGTLKQQPLVGHLSLDSLSYFTFFFFFAFCKHSTLNSQAAGSSGPNSLLFASTIVSFPKP